MNVKNLNDVEQLQNQMITDHNDNIVYLSIAI